MAGRGGTGQTPPTTETTVILNGRGYLHRAERPLLLPERLQLLLQMRGLPKGC